jgi:hypothetical protein
MQTNPKRRTASAPLRKGHVYPVNLNQAATALNVSKNHLSQVLRGKRQSKSLTARYAALVKKASPN